MRRRRLVRALCVCVGCRSSLPFARVAALGSCLRLLKKIYFLHAKVIKNSFSMNSTHDFPPPAEYEPLNQQKFSNCSKQQINSQLSIPVSFYANLSRALHVSVFL